MNYKKSFINLKIVGSEPELSEFLDLCSTIQKLGIRGSSRKISVVVDGDGSGRLTFYLNGESDSIPMTDGSVPSALPEMYIGE